MINLPSGDIKMGLRCRSAIQCDVAGCIIALDAVGEIGLGEWLIRVGGCGCGGGGRKRCNGGGWRGWCSWCGWSDGRGWSALRGGGIVALAMRRVVRGAGVGKVGVVAGV